MTDCIIIGSGPAGISAALTLKANAKSFLFIGSPDLSEKIEKAESIRNYPGFLGGSGKAFSADLKKQLKDNEIELLDENIVIERVTGDGERETLLAPLWSLKKTIVINEIDKELYRRDTYQGIYCKKG